MLFHCIALNQHSLYYWKQRTHLDIFVSLFPYMLFINIGFEDEEY
jgi:hypothetical protein